MKILIVNGFRESKQGNETFVQFQQMVYGIFREESHLVDTEIEFYVRSLRSLDDVIFEVNSTYTKKESAKNFDMMDILIVAGDGRILPWSAEAMKLMLLMIMCFRTNKIVYCSGLGMSTLIYLSASNFEKYYAVQKMASGGSKDHLQLDPVTGDLFQLNDQGTLTGHGNVGMHQRKAAQEFQVMGKYIMQAPVYHPPKIKELYGFYFNNENELICYLKKMFLHHWALHDVAMEFKVETQNSWDIHKFSFMNQDKKFTVLADGERGPLIIEYVSMLATLFVPSKKYPATIVILRNFIKRYCDLYKSQQVKVLSIENVRMKQAQDMDRLDQFKHSGLAANTKYQRFIVSNNAIDIGLQRRNPKLFRNGLKSGNTTAEVLKGDRNPLSVAPSKFQSDLDHPTALTKARQIRLFLHPQINEEALQGLCYQRVPGSWTQRVNNSEEKPALQQSAMKFTKIRYLQNDSIFNSEDRARSAGKGQLSSQRNTHVKFLNS